MGVEERLSECCFLLFPFPLPFLFFKFLSISASFFLAGLSIHQKNRTVVLLEDLFRLVSAIFALELHSLRVMAV